MCLFLFSLEFLTFACVAAGRSKCGVATVGEGRLAHAQQVQYEIVAAQLNRRQCVIHQRAVNDDVIAKRTAR